MEQLTTTSLFWIPWAPAVMRANTPQLKIVKANFKVDECLTVSEAGQVILLP